VNPFHLENATMLTLSTHSNISAVTSSHTLYLSKSPLLIGNSFIVEKSEFLRAFLPSPKILPSLLDRIQITRASYPSFSTVLIHTTFSCGTSSRVTGINLSHFITLVISIFLAKIPAIS